MAKFQNWFNENIWNLKRDAISGNQESRVMDVIVDEWTDKYGLTKPVDIEAYGKVYGKEELVYICVSAIAQTSSKAPLMVMKKTVEDGETVYVKDTNQENPIAQLFTQVNQVTTEEDFKEQSLTALELQGNAYWWIIRDSLNIPRELFFLRPDWVKIVPDKNGYVKGYVFENGHQKEKFEPEEILHIKYHDPRSYFYGLSPIQAAKVTVQASMYSKLFQKSFFLNSARPSGVLKTEQGLNDKEVKRVGKLWRKAHGGPKNAFRTAILQKGLEYQSVSISPKDSDFIAQMENFTERIMGVFKVPPVLGAVYKESHYNNADIQRKIFWEEVLSAKLDKIAGQINEFMIYPVWGDDYKVAYDYSGIEVLQEKEEDQIKRFEVAVSGGLMTPNEARNKIGLEPIEGGDNLYMSFNMTKVGGDTQSDTTSDTTVKKKELNDDLAAKLAETRERGVNEIRKNYYNALENMFLDQGDKVAEAIAEEMESTKDADDIVHGIDSDKVWEGSNFGQMIDDVSSYFVGACMMLGIDAARKLSGTDIPLDLTSPKIEPVKEAMLKQLKIYTDNTSKAELRKIISDAIDEKQTVQELKRNIKNSWRDNASKTRAERIARTETSNAYGKGANKYYRETGATEKKWLTMGDRRVANICRSNGRQGWIPIEEGFSSGNEHEPNHVNCRCSVIYK